MQEYEFTLKFRLENSSENPEVYLAALEAAGCDDAAVGLGQHGRIALNFTRSAQSAADAVSSAIFSVQKAIPGSRLVEATPDYVGITDVAEMFGFSRQHMRQLIVANEADFPQPAHEGKPSIWHLSHILQWFREHEARRFQDDVYEISAVNMQINTYIAFRAMPTPLKENLVNFQLSSKLETVVSSLN
ncbi:helix-turn-helix transcriptional regulator [Nitrosococcus oceani]|uniref:DNA-binding protein n=2 Tax=Nitrosococcus oceani TaxID=1229 RepID=Q3J705_NITOC|nr:hypothetical protein [Nitrosococcus oceani]KFI18131.1 DNA-binding protein [Nitrosococcus oceani C-27]ABA59391.1 putative DNA-binding protein [Nitrosococcus oceani ATCC 19707]EDZ66218.1 hypothetical protein NOC27_2898 [Nitrosococcus oceani AFC27]KFI21417.1 DNA-binding protein [Nitrosococcus oceani]GEM20037.1 hypothetical protein NONS58_14420 [Nitrosococcus oceani]